MNLLKTISMKLTVNLVNMFFHVDEDGAAFPLYTEAVKFIAHKCAPLLRGGIWCVSVSMIFQASLREAAVPWVAPTPCALKNAMPTC